MIDIDWNKLTKAELVHVIESTNAERYFLRSVEAFRKGEFDPCWECVRIAKKFGIVWGA